MGVLVANRKPWVDILVAEYGCVVIQNLELVGCG